jgi:hypothetical protein
VRKLNKPLLRRLARKLRRLRHEEHYDQTEILNKTSCGTVACVAGHAVLAAGYKLRLERLEPCGITDCRICATVKPDVVCVDPKTGKEVDVLTHAQRALGLTGREAERLFDGGVVGAWPDAYADRWKAGNERPSRIAADLLDAVADTDGEILR